MSIYQPYFYIIQDVRNGMYYAGSKFGKDANPNNLLVSNGYITSSTTIKKIISDHGIETFIIKKIKLFKNANLAYEYETKFLKKVNARHNPRFYNFHNNDGYMNIRQSKEYIYNRYGVENPFMSEEIKDKIKKTNLDRYGVQSILQSPLFRDEFKKTMVERYGVEYSMQSAEIREKAKNTNIERYGVENAMQSVEIQEKAKHTNIERYGVEYAAMSHEVQKKTIDTNLQKYGHNWGVQSEIVKNKIKNTNMEKYGVENVSKSLEIIEKISNIQKSRAYRPITNEIRKYTKKFKGAGLSRGWFNKQDDELYIILDELKRKYGEL